MSVAAINWAFRSIEGADFTPSEALVLLALAHCHNQETGRCDPSNAFLCRKTGLSERAVRGALRGLEAKRLLLTTYRKQENGRGKRNKTNRYNLRDGAKSAGGMGQNLPPKENQIPQPSQWFDLVTVDDVGDATCADDSLYPIFRKLAVS